MKGDHPQRRLLNDEVHARPYELLSAPLRLEHHARLTDDVAVERALLAELCASHGLEPPDPEAGFLSLDLGDWRLRWERHTEFSTWTLIVPGPFDDPFGPAPHGVDAELRARLPGQRLVALKLAVEPKGLAERSLVELGALFDSNTVAGSRVTDGAADVWIDYQKALEVAPNSEPLKDLAHEQIDRILDTDVRQLPRSRILSEFRTPLCVLPESGYRNDELVRLRTDLSIRC